MRIISGTLGGRRFDPPAKNWPTRPTTDLAKEGLYNVLQHRLDFDEMRMLDLFGGTGNHCFECISRGCGSATYVDQHPPAVRFVRELAERFGVEEAITVVRSDVFRFLREYRGDAFTYCFAGPPYPLPQLDEVPDAVYEAGVLAPEGLLVLEHNPNHDFTQHPHFVELRKYGKTRFSFFQSDGL